MKRIDRDALAAGGVATAAFIASAQHIWHVTQLAGNPAAIAALHPLALDGLLYVGIRGIQRGQRGWGTVALLYGAAYSLWFNAASYQAVQMPKLVLAACLPIAFVLAILIVHGQHKVEAPEPVVREVEVIKEVQVEKIVHVYPELLPIIPPVRLSLSNRPTSGGPALSWDVDKVVDMVLKGEDVSALVSDKIAQRVRRVLRAAAEDKVAAEITKGDLTAKFVGRVLAAREKSMDA
jgi:hypothetical protein